MFRFHCLRRKERNGSSSLKVTVVHNDSAFDASVVPDLCLSSVSSVNATLMETVFFFVFFLRVQNIWGRATQVEMRWLEEQIRSGCMYQKKTNKL